jgi:hypothetical protein
MEPNIENTKFNTSEIKAKFDDVLVRNINRLLEIDTLTPSLSFNLPTITCLLLLVEREDDIKVSPDSPPDRYTRETFLDALSDVGLSIDDDLMASFQSLAQYGYVMIGADEKYHTQISSFAIVSFLNNLFPEMTGMNLVAYILQAIDEVMSERKELKDALDQLDQTLVSKGIPLSKQDIEKEEKVSLKKQPEQKTKTAESMKMSDDLKSAFRNRMSTIRQHSFDDSGEPRVFTAQGSTGTAKIRKLYSPGEEEATKNNLERAKEEAEKAARDAEEKAAKEAEERSAEIAVKEAEIKAAEMVARDAELKLKEAQEKAREAEIRAQKYEEEKDSSRKETKSESDDIEKQIAAYQDNLLMSCPVCNIGKIRSEKTDNDKVYYHCSNENCGFVSWGKPFPFQCPVCKNSFLVEFMSSDNNPGLKCPRATCSFTQNHLRIPAQDAPPSGSQPKKKRKLVRRVRRR